MGLDLVCGDYHIKVGPYSKFASIRIMWMRAAKTFLEELPFKDEYYVKHPDKINSYDYNETKKEFMERKQFVINTLQSTIPKDNNVYYDEEKFIQLWFLTALTEFDLAGLLYFVYHSDHDGYLSPGQSLDILSTLKLLFPYIMKLDNQTDSECQYWKRTTTETINNPYQSHFLYPIFNISVKTNTKVKFC